jgi:2-iminobutanoate/2-iminopropanoate deaminase
LFNVDFVLVVHSYYELHSIHAGQLDRGSFLLPLERIFLMQTHNSEEAPAAIGPYSQAIRTGNLLFCSGQTPLDPESMTLVGETIEEQTEQALRNLEVVLKEAGLTLSHVVKTSVFLQSMDDFSGMNAVYERVFEGHKPARTTVAVRQNPLSARVEIECIAEFQA